MTDVDKIVALLGSDAVEKRIAAAIVLGEIRARGAGVAEALAGTLDSGIALLQRHALEALARVGAKKGVARILPLLAAREEDVRRAAVEAMVSVGDDALPAIRARMSGASPEERRSIDAILAALGGKDAFHALLDGLAASDAEAAKAAAIAVRQRVKDADARQRRGYLAEAERFLEKQTTRGPRAKGAGGDENARGGAGAIAAGVKILGYLEDEKAVGTLLQLTRAKGNAAPVRQEALIALRFLLGNEGADARKGVRTPRRGADAHGTVVRTPRRGADAYEKVLSALVDAAEDPDRSLAQTALHTLAGLALEGEAMKRLEKLVAHPDVERARFVLEMLGRQGGADPVKLLVKVLATTRDKRRAEIAASCLVQPADGEQPQAAPGSGPVREEAVAPLARALLETEDADRAWLLRNVLRPSAKKVAAAMRKPMLDTAARRLAAGDRNWEPLLATARDADAAGAAEALRALAGRLRKTNPEKALTVLRVVCRNEGCTDDDRYALAAAELSRAARDTRPAARAGDESLRLLGALLDRGFDVGAHLRKDRSLELDHLYYVGFHFSEQGHPLGEELLRTVVEKGGRAKIAKMAKSKLSLVEAS